MQKLAILSKLRGSGQGSVLVGVVAFSILMALAGAGYLAVTGSTVNHEIEALENEAAFLAAESGLLIGTNWLRDSVNWENTCESGRNDVFTGTINGMSVDVDIVSLGNDKVDIRSNASGGGLTYTKRVSWTAEKIGGDAGTLIYDLGASGGVGGSGLNNTWFDGPTHSNAPVHLSSVSNPGAGGAGVKFVNGGLTVHNKTQTVNFAAGGHWANYGEGNNNYDFGLLHHNIAENDQGKTDKLDEYFEVSYTHSQDSLYMPRLTTQDYTFPQNLSATNRAYLVFDDNGADPGLAKYYYYDAGGVRQGPVTVEIDGKVLRVPNDVSVLGLVDGQVTVVTNPGDNIYPVGDLTYVNFPDPTTLNPDGDEFLNYDNTDNYRLGDYDDGAGNTDMLALVAGGDIHFQKEKMTYNPSTQNLDVAGVSKQSLWLTAQLIAIEPTHGLMWDTKKMTGDSKDFQINEFDYTLRAIGNRVIRTWFSYDAGGVQANQQIRFYFDTRLLEGLKGPGVPDIHAASETGEKFFMLQLDWHEENLTS
jgi:hypothetical protein